MDSKQGTPLTRTGGWWAPDGAHARFGLAAWTWARRALPASMIVGVSVCAAAVVWQTMLDTQRADADVARHRAEVRAKQLSEAASQEFDATLRRIDAALLHLRRVYIDDKAHFESAVQDVVAAYSADMLQSVTVVGADGYTTYASGPMQPHTYLGDRQHFRMHNEGRSDQIHVGAPVIGRAAAVPIVQVTRAIRDGKRFMGVIGMALRPDQLSARLAALQIEPSDMLAVVRSEGEFIARSHGLDQALKTKLPQDRPFLLAPPGARGLFRSPSTVDKVPLVFAWRRFADWPLSVVAAVDEQRELGLLEEQQARERRHTAQAQGLLVVFALGIAAFVLRVGQKNEQLARSESRHRALFRYSKVPMLMIDPVAGNIVDANQAAEAFYGWNRLQLRRMLITDINVLQPLEVAAEMLLARSQQRDCFHFVHRLASGESRQVEVRSGPLEIDGRTLLYSIVHDITDRRRAEAAVASEAARLSALLETATDGIHIIDEAGRLIEFNHAFAQMLGYADDDLSGMNVSQWDVAISPDVLLSMVRDLMRQPRRFETRHQRKDGTVIDVEISAKSVQIDGRTLLYNSARDVTVRKRDEQQLRIAAAAFESQDGIIVTDVSGTILRVNQAFTAITGYSSAEAVGRKPSLLHSGRHGAEFYTAMWEAVLRVGIWTGEIWNRRKNGSDFLEWLTITAVRTEAGEVSHFVGTLTDITSRKAAEDEVKHLAFYDTLTHLPNRRLMMDRLQHALASSGRSGRGGAVLFIDLDNFKTLNDTRGHGVGDLLLQEVAVRLSACLRASDTVARFGGDEFVVLMEDLSPKPQVAASQAGAVGEKILTSLNQPFQLAGLTHHATASIGVTLFGAQQDAIEELLKRADLAMYQAKAGGRSGLRYFDPEMQAVITARSALEADLRQGLQRREFTLQFQPQVDTAGSVIGAEALLRWQHPERGILLPGEFIAVAEDTGLILPLGQWVLEAACAQLTAWTSRPQLAALTLAVNVSALQFRQDDFVERVVDTLARSGAHARRLKLELTESVLLASLESTADKMNQLQAQGVGFSLDDFGTGHSSLAYLSRLPINELKIDRSFVMGIESSENARAICSATISLAHALKLEVVAEGVESTKQRDFLSRAHACDFLQGYLFSRPLPAAEFDAYVLSQIEVAA